MIILLADKTQLLALKDILHVFSQSAGLGVNYHKSFMVPINVDAPNLIICLGFWLLGGENALHLFGPASGHYQA